VGTIPTYIFNNLEVVIIKFFVIDFSAASNASLIASPFTGKGWHCNGWRCRKLIMGIWGDENFAGRLTLVRITIRIFMFDIYKTDYW
jgi:hypothetical protein